MNLCHTTAAYATVCRHAGVPLRFPGSPAAWTALHQITDAGLLAGATEWALTPSGAVDDNFNITKGTCAAGIRGLVVVTAGDRPGLLQPRGIGGDIEDVPWPLLHGTLWYTGMLPLRPYLVTSARDLAPEDVEVLEKDLADRLNGCTTTLRAAYSGTPHVALVRHDATGPTVERDAIPSVPTSQGSPSEPRPPSRLRSVVVSVAVKASHDRSRIGQDDVMGPVEGVGAAGQLVTVFALTYATL